MVLQEILMKPEDNEELYNRTEKVIRKMINGFSFDLGAVWSTNTYFNSLSIGKWKKYCEVGNISLNMDIKGKFLLNIYHVILIGNDIKENLLLTKDIENSEKQTYSYAISNVEEGIVYFTLEAKEKESVCYGARYEAEVMKEQKIKIALNICTYKREKYLLRNIEVIKKAFLENDSSEMQGHLEVYITDNGNTLDIEALENNVLHIVYNPNVGGAGGFTRGLIEINKRKKISCITHAIFMDDDVEIEPEAILRTYRMLKILKKEYQTAFIAGAMLRLDMKYVQHENGALWNAGKCEFVNRGLNLSDFKNVVFNEKEQKRDYAAWWYCCIPARVIREDNLPIPIFIHQDDTEYSLRNAQHIITMNGIAIWHEASEHKRVSTNEYYNLRNMLIVNSKYCPNFGIKDAKRQLTSRMLSALLRFRYKDMYLIYRAIEDFCKGPGWLQTVDAVKLHKELQEEGYRLIDVSDKLNGRKNMDEVHIIKNPFTPKKKSWTVCKVLKLLGHGITLNGWILPAKKDYEIHYMNVHPAKLFRKGEVVLYDDASNVGIVVKRRFGAIFEFIMLYKKANKVLDKCYTRSQNSYNQTFSIIYSIDNWKRHLGRI